MVQNRPIALDSLLLLPKVGLGDFVESFALHTSHRVVPVEGVLSEGHALPSLSNKLTTTINNEGLAGDEIARR